MCFTTLIWFISVYNISNSCWFCIHFWIKWELWKTFDGKMIGWPHFRLNERLKIIIWFINKQQVGQLNLSTLQMIPVYERNFNSISLWFHSLVSKQVCLFFGESHMSEAKACISSIYQKERASQIFLDPIQKRALSRFVQLEAVYLEALL